MGKTINPYSKLSLSRKKKQLIEALRAGDTEKANWLLKYKFDVNKPTDSEGQTALDIACQSGYPDIVKILLEKGAQPNSNPGQDGSLHHACSHGYYEIVRCLLDAGARINQPGKGGWTPLIHAAARGNSS